MVFLHLRNENFLQGMKMRIENREREEEKERKKMLPFFVTQNEKDAAVCVCFV